MSGEQVGARARIQHVFVYGTLRAGEANDISVAAARHGIAPPRFVGQAALAGRLFDFGAYPGLVVDERAENAAECVPAVIGDVYAIDAALIAVLDEIEEVSPGDDALFLVRYAHLDVKGERISCRFYPVRRESVQGCPEISGGDWVAYRRAHSD